jgi:hypothetical protein
MNPIIGSQGFLGSCMDAGLHPMPELLPINMMTTTMTMMITMTMIMILRTLLQRICWHTYVHGSHRCLPLLLLQVGAGQAIGLLLQPQFT